MFKSPAISAIALLLLAAIFFGAFVVLLRERFAIGDIYGEYSTLRADPMGSKVLFEAIDRLPGVASSRNLLPVRRIAGSQENTILFTGVSPFLGGPDIDFDVEAKRLAEEGSRVVVVFAPRVQMPFYLREMEAERESDETREETAEGQPLRWYAFGRELDARLRLVEVSPEALPLQPVRKAAERWDVGEHPEFWLSSVFFDLQSDEWRVLLEVEERPVLVEREYGEGSMVLMSDAYWMSNEAMLRHSRPGFLSWVIGGGQQVIFDETHHGVTRRIGMMRLIRDYGFLPAVIVLIGTALLFIWKNMAAFPPREPTSREGRPAHLAGRDAGKGLVNLLRRTVPRRRVLVACWDAWKSSQDARRLRHRTDAVARAERIIEKEGGTANPKRLAEAYREVVRLVNER